MIHFHTMPSFTPGLQNGFFLTDFLIKSRFHVRLYYPLFMKIMIVDGDTGLTWGSKILSNTGDLALHPFHVYFDLGILGPRNHFKLYVAPAVTVRNISICMYGFCVIFGVTSDYFHFVMENCCFLWGKDRTLKCYLEKVRHQRSLHNFYPCFIFTVIFNI